MTQQAKRSITWSAAAVIAAAGIIWGGAARIERIDNCSAQAEAKAEYAVEIVVEWRTKAIVFEEQLAALEARVDRLEDLEALVRDIHEAVVR
jgi:hypothetical protein